MHLNSQIHAWKNSFNVASRSGVRLSGIPDHQNVPVLTKDVRVILFCSYTLDAQLMKGIFHLGISFSCWLFKMPQPALTECALVCYFDFVIKGLAFSVIISSVMCFIQNALL